MGKVLLFALAALAPASAGAGQLAGVVRDGGTERGLAGVRIEVDGGALRVATDAGGAFAVDLPGGRHRLQIEHDGYQLVDRTLEMPAGGLQVEIALDPAAVQLHESLVVSAAREPDWGFETPRATGVVTDVDIASRGARTTPEAVMDSTGVWVQKTNHGGGSPFIRGLSGNQVLVLVDGIRLNNATFRYGPNQYLATADPLALERIEIVRGTGSVLHGSDALGGVVAVFSPRPEFSPGSALSGRFLTRLASGGQEKTGRLELQASGARIAVRGGLSLRDFGDLRAGGALGVEAPSGYGEAAGDLKAAVRLSDAHLLTAAYQHVHQSDVPRWDQVAQRGFLRYSFDPQVRQLAYVQLHSSFASAALESLRATVSLHRSDETRVRQARGSPIVVDEHDVVDTWGASLQARSRPAAGWRLVWGAEAHHDRVGSERHDRHSLTGTVTARRGLYPDGAEALSAAVFAEAQYRTERLHADCGLRWNHHRVTAADATFGAIDVEPSALVANAAVGYEVARGHRLFASADQGFRAPNIDDLSTLGLFDFGVEVPSPGLRPERGWSYELGWKVRRAVLAAGISVYRTQLHDLIDRVPDTYQGMEYLEGQRVYRRANVGRAYVQGLEADVEWQPGWGVRAFGGLAYTFGQMISSDQPMRRIPPLNGSLALRWASSARASLEAWLRFAARQDRLAPGDRADHRISPTGTPAWTVLSLRGSYAPHTRVTLRGGIENVLDEAYRIHGSGIDGQGRTAWAAAELRF